MSYIAEAWTAGQTKRFHFSGRFFRLIETATPVDVLFFKDGKELDRAENIEGGYAETVEGGFDRIEIKSAQAQSLRFLTRASSSVRIDRAVGSVSITGTPSVNVANKDAVNSAFAQSAPAVTNASGNLLAANANRRTLIIQNNHATGNIFVRLDGAAATTGNGIKIPALGGTLVLDGFAPTAAITAIGDIANNTAVIVSEG
jgi:hypothetical protein